MLTVSQPQLSLWDAVLPAELTTLNGELRKIDQFLDDPVFIRPFVEHFHKSIGRPGTPVDTFIRLMYLKHRYGLGYELLVEQVKDSIMWRRFCRIPIDGEVPDASTLVKLVKRFGPATIAELNAITVQKAATEEIIRAGKLRVDTTVIEANIHYPTDTTILHDGVRVVTRLVKKLKAGGLATTEHYRDHTRSARRRVLRIAKVLRRRTNEAVTEVRRISGEVADIAEDTLSSAKQVLETALAQVAQIKGPAATKAKALTQRLGETVAHLKKAVDQTREVNAGNTHPPDRLVSMHDPDARPIRRGKMRVDTEFGYKVSLGESEERLITSCQVYKGNPSDESLLEPCAHEHVENVNAVPGVVSGDRGYGSNRNDEMLADMGVKYVSIPRRGKIQWQRSIVEHQRWFKRHQRWRAGIEATISVLKRQYGLDRSLSRGYEGTCCWVGYGVMAYNLRRLSVLIE